MRQAGGSPPDIEATAVAARRHDGRFLADPLCTYDAIALAWWRRRAGGAPFPLDTQGRPAPEWWLQVPARAGHTVPPVDSAFFTDTVGLPMRTAGVRSLARRLASAAHMDCDPSELGAKSFRIGGATDWRDCLGDSSAGIVQQRGRWDSTVALIYQWPLLASHLAATMWVRPGGSADLEARVTLSKLILCFYHYKKSLQTNHEDTRIA
jgi:hypothetical protein